MQVSQIFLSDNGAELSPFLGHATGTVRQAFPDADHQIYTKETLRAFIETNYPGDVLWAYDCLKPYSYKADLGRFCLLNKLGGWYFDIAVLRLGHVPQQCYIPSRITLPCGLQLT